MSDADPIFPGGAFEGHDDSAAVVGQISLSPFAFKFEAEAVTLDMPLHGLEIDLDETGERPLFSHANFPGWTVYSLDPAILEHRHLQRPGVKERLAQIRRQQVGSKHARRVYLTLGGIAAVLVGLWAFTDAIVGMIVKTLPPKWEQEVGKEAFAEMREIFDLSDDPALTNRVHLVAQRLKKGLPYDAPKFRFHVAAEPFINAIALPGGDVVVMQGLLADSTPEELAGVLAHEMSHVIEKHAMRQIAQEVGPSFVTKYVFGGEGALAALVAGSSMIGQLQYSRDNERQADDEAFDILLNANIDPRSLAKYFKKIRNVERKLERKYGKNDDDLFSTHPPTAERIRNLEARWEKSPKKTGFEPINAGPNVPAPVTRFKLPF